MSSKIFTLIFVKQNSQLLLGHKTRGLGKGYWNGFGGKLELNETIIKCAERELKEECNLSGKNLKQLGIVKYVKENDNQFESIVHVFTCCEFIGCEKASEEMDPIKWFQYNKIPFEEMWPDAKTWLSFVLDERYFSAKVVYDDGRIKNTVTQGYDCLENALKSF